MTVGTLERFKKALDENDATPELKPTSGIGVDLRAYKDAGELELLQRAIDIGDQAFEETASRLEVGMTEKEAAWIFEKAVRERGAESISFETIVAIGPNAARPHHATSDSKLVEGQTIVFDCGARYQGYCSDLTRTVVLGQADDEIKRVYDIVLTAQLAAIDMVTSGMTGEDCDAIARKIISEAGHENGFGHSLGHGLGLEVHENPGVGPNAKGKLENGMPFTIEPGIYIPGWGGVRIEDVVVLENDKARVLSHAAKMTF
jgi:Xaa-Pro aminopeptidase